MLCKQEYINAFMTVRFQFRYEIGNFRTTWPWPKYALTFVNNEYCTRWRPFVPSLHTFAFWNRQVRNNFVIYFGDTVKI